MKTPFFKVRNPLIEGPKYYKYTARYVYRNGKLVNVKDIVDEDPKKKMLTDQK